VISTQSSRTRVYTNLKSAINTGFEIDVRKSLNFISTSSAFLGNLYLSGNYTYTESAVQIVRFIIIGIITRQVQIPRNAEEVEIKLSDLRTSISKPVLIALLRLVYTRVRED